MTPNATFRISDKRIGALAVREGNGHAPGHPHPMAFAGSRAAEFALVTPVARVVNAATH